MASSYAEAARRYDESIVAGDILACRWVKQACQRQLDDLDRCKGKASPYRLNLKLTDKQGCSFYPADNLCAFIERLPHVKGPLAGEPIRLEPWQVFILSTVFGWAKVDGKRRFQRSYIEVPRGNAKSTLSSAVALYMLTADGEGGAEVCSLATMRDQARIVFGDAQTMARKSPGFLGRFALDAEQDALRLIDRTAATRNPFDANYSKVEDADWETCSLVLDPLTVQEQLSRGW
jgi:phage terminase large subunit-like protein